MHGLEPIAHELQVIKPVTIQRGASIERKHIIIWLYPGVGRCAGGEKEEEEEEERHRD
jgi:hypothetical protein